MNRLPKVSQAACASQHATFVAIVPRVQVAPPLNEYARKMLLVVVLERTTRLFVLVGLTTTKLSDWLPAVALTFTTGAVQANGTNEPRGVGSRSGGFIHLRVPSGTSIPIGASTRAWSEDVVGARRARTAANAIRCRGVFMLMRLVRSLSVIGRAAIALSSVSAPNGSRI